MIRARLIPLSALTESYLEPFLTINGHLPPEQHPLYAPRINTQEKLRCYEFFDSDNEVPVGYAILKLRKYILADLYFGPVVLRERDYDACITALSLFLRRSGRLLLRVFPPKVDTGIGGLPAGFNWATSVVDVARDRAALLQSFSSNHRQSIAKAIGAGITIKLLKAGEIPAWAAGYAHMYRRKGIKKNERQTQAMLTELFSPAKTGGHDAFVLGAYLRDEPALIGGGVFLCSGDTCSYYQGFSAKMSPSLPVQHLLLLEAMLGAARRGCSRFDLYGYSLDETDRQLTAVNNFKRWFRGEIIHYPPTVIIPLHRFAWPYARWLTRTGRL